MSTHSFENKKSVPLRVLSFHFAYGKMKTAIRERVCIANPLSYTVSNYPELALINSGNPSATNNPNKTPNTGRSKLGFRSFCNVAKPRYKKLRITVCFAKSLM
jgi:hypothetical protein